MRNRYSVVLGLLLVLGTFTALHAQRNSPPPVSSMTNMYDCYPGHTKWTEADNAQFAKMYFAFYCECKKGVPNKQREKQLLAGMDQMRKQYNEFMSSGSPSFNGAPRLSSCKVVGGAGAASGAAGDPEAARMRQTIRNYKKAMSIVNEARMRSNRLSEQLAQMQNIDPNATAGEIMSQFNSMMSSLEGLDQQLRDEINMGYLNNATGVLQDYNAGNSEGAALGTLATLGSIADNEEAKEKIKKKKEQLQRQKNQALREAANRMIRFNNEALQDWLELAANILEEDRESFYMDKVFYHSANARYIANNFNFSNTGWAQPQYKDPQPPSFKTYYNPKHEQHYEAALRKKELYDKYGNEGLYHGSIAHISAAISLEPKRAQYYLAKGRIANPKELVASLNNYLAAYSLDPKLFNANLDVELELVQAQANRQVKEAILQNDQVLLRDYLDARLFDVISIEGMDMFSYAAYQGQTDVLKLIEARYISKYSDSRQRQELYQTAMVEATANNQVQTLQWLNRSSGQSLDFRFQGRYLIDYAANNEAPLTFFEIYKNSNKQSSWDRQYGEDLIYLKAFALNDLSRAAQIYCDYSTPTLKAHSERLLQEATVNQAYFDLVLSCREAKQLVREEPSLQREAQALAQSYMGFSNVGSANQGGTSANTGMAANSTLILAVLEEMNIDPSEVAQMSMAQKQELARLLQERGLANQSKPSQASTTAPRSGADNLNRMLQENLLQSDFLAAQELSLTQLALRSDHPQLFGTLQAQGLLSPVDQRGRPLVFSFVRQGGQILASGLVNQFDFNQSLDNQEAIAHQLAFVNCPHLNLLLPRLDLNKPGPHGWTALHFASRENNLRLTQALVRAGADPDIEDEWGRTARDIAKEREFEDLEEYLKSL